MRIALLILATVSLLAGVASAQDYGEYYPRHWVWGVSYDIAVPTGNTKDYISEVSFRGIGVEGRKFLNPSVSAGVSVAWQVFFEKGFRTDTTADGAVVSGTQHRTLNHFPILLTVYKYWGEPDAFRPYVGLNGGIYIIENRLEVGLFADQETNVHFGGAPEIGCQLPTGKFLGFVSAKYHLTTSAGKTDSQSYLDFRIGFGLRN